MKITFTQHRELSGRKVRLGDTMTSPADGTDDQLQAYITNGIAELTTDALPHQKTEVSPDVK